MDDTSSALDHIADLHQKLYITLLSSLTENWMSLDYTMPQLKVLLCLYINGPYRMSDLATTLGVSTPTVTGIVNRLVGRGVISRGAETEDRRVVTCQLTPQGERAISALWLARFEVFREIFGALTHQEMDVVAKALEVVLEAARKRDAGLEIGGTVNALEAGSQPQGLSRIKATPMP